MNLNKLSVVLAGCIAGLALSAQVNGAIIVYSGAAGPGAANVGIMSSAIDLGALFPAFTASTSLGVTLSGPSGGTFSETLGNEDIQMVQGCTLAAGSCGDADWFNILGVGLSLGGHTITGSPPTEVFSFGAGPITVNTAVRSLRLAISGDLPDPSSAVGVTGTLDVTAVPEPGTWAMILAGILGVGAIARRRLDGASAA